MGWVWHHSTKACWHEPKLVIDEAAACVSVKRVAVLEERVDINKCIAFSLTSVVVAWSRRRR